MTGMNDLILLWGRVKTSSICRVRVDLYVKPFNSK